MASALAAVAFLCVVFLACLLPAYWTSRNVAMLTLIWWLILCNAIQGVNAVVWAGNTETKIPVWCDISTKLLMGVRVAIPATCVCLSNRVRHLLMTGDAKGGIGILSFDLITCIAIPVTYMVLHIIVQDYRFNLTENFGCSPAIYDSIPALFLVWLPPLIFSICAIALTCTTMYSGHKRGFALVCVRQSGNGGHHTFDFLRPLLRSLLIASLLLVSSVFSLHAVLATPSHFLPWTSWNAVHAQLSQANVIPISAPMERTDIALTWWTVPASSFVLIGVFLANLARASGEDNSLDGYRTMIWRTSILFTGENEVRPLSASSSVMDLRSHMSSGHSSETFMSIHPMGQETKGSTRSRLRTRVKLAPLSIHPNDKSTSPAISPDSDDTDISFVQSTISYLDSSVGRAAIASMPRPPSMFRPACLPGYLPGVAPPTAAVEPEQPSKEDEDRHRLGSPRRRRPESIIAGPWPRPPSSIPPCPDMSPDRSPNSRAGADTPNTSAELPSAIRVPPPVVHRLRPPSSASMDVSLASSTVSTSAYALPPQATRDSPTLPHFSPSADAGIPMANGAGRGQPGLSQQAKRTRNKDGLHTLGSLRAREKRVDGIDGGAIYMTVVQETV
ncbi:pheromone A receptor-domain-containing protein [Fomitopsis betulina]|nr:pheromone A receptor-domain-containing protein [Fomitopsis betulina]